MRKYWPGLLVCLAVVLPLSPTTAAQEQETDATSVHWAYSAYFGSGWYRMGNDRDVFVIRGTPRWQLREANLSADGQRTIGIEFRFAITGGLDSFSLDDIPGVTDPDNLTSLSVIPGIDITIPVTDRWQLRPFAAIGWGSVLDGSESAWTYWAGVKSHYSFQKGKLDWALINGVTYVGNSPNDAPSDDFWPLMAGLEFDYPIGTSQSGGEQLYLSWHGMYTNFEDDLDQVISDGTVDPITDEWEFGIALRRKESRIKIWWLSFDRLGLAYRRSSSGDLEGISFVFRSVFER